MDPRILQLEEQVRSLTEEKETLQLRFKEKSLEWQRKFESKANDVDMLTQTLRDQPDIEVMKNRVAEEAIRPFRLRENELNALNDRLREDLNNSKRKSQHLLFEKDMEIRNLENLLNTSKKDFETKNDQQIATIKKLQNEVLELQQLDVDGYERQIRNLNSTLYKLRQDMAAIQAENTTILSENNRMKSEVNGIQGINSNVVKTLQTNISHLEEKLKRKEDLLKKTKDSLTLLRSEAIQREADFAKALNDKTNETITLEKALNETRDMLRDANNSKDEHIRQIIAVQEKLQESARAIQENLQLKEKLLRYNDIEEERDELKQTIEEYKAKNANLMNELNDANAKSNHLSESSDRVQSLEVELEKIQTEKDIIENKVLELKSKYDDLKNEENLKLRNLQREFDNYKNQTEQDEINRNMEYQQLKDKYKQFKKKRDMVLKKNEVDLAAEKKKTELFDKRIHDLEEKNSKLHENYNKELERFETLIA
eukprot:TRINITY_DN571_c0_g1_i1.p1 TRINITY_DN571_c0_g1~~TRINITY_DN571_c0_g1_i1.p1  ORF type:complete len:484 (-),score=173.98 TRINITY_DN571_c0_g1_i1:102-1553(-)